MGVNRSATIPHRITIRCGADATHQNVNSMTSSADIGAILIINNNNSHNINYNSTTTTKTAVKETKQNKQGKAEERQPTIMNENE